MDCDGIGAPGGEAGVEKAGDARKTRGIRFSESEWEEVKNAAAAHEMPAAEFVRERILALARAPKETGAPAVASSMVPLIERMFRYTWFLATEKRDAITNADGGDGSRAQHAAGDADADVRRGVDHGDRIGERRCASLRARAGSRARREAREDGVAAATPWSGETGCTAAEATARPARRCGSGGAANHRDAERPGLVHQVLGNAVAGEGEHALRQEAEQLVVSAERCGAAVAVPLRPFG